MCADHNRADAPRSIEGRWASVQLGTDAAGVGFGTRLLGIGQSRLTGNLAGFTPDFACQVSDAEALPYVFDLLQHEGLCLGGSTAINVAGAVRLARELGPGHTVVTILCDNGTRYRSKLFNPSFLRRKQLPVPAWLD